MNSYHSFQLHQPLTRADRQIALSLIVGLLVLILGSFTLTWQKAQAVDQPSFDEQWLLTLINHERTNQNLKPLVYNSRLAKAAQAKAQDMLTSGYFDHVSPTGQTPWAFIDAAGYRYLKAGENLAIDFPTVRGPVPAWMASPSHRANILQPDYKETGLAEVRGSWQGRSTTLVVQLFGTAMWPF